MRQELFDNDEIRFRYAVNFDLSISKLQQYFNQEHPKSAYGVLAKYMKLNGFEHRQYSGYMSCEALTQEELLNTMRIIHNQLPWLKECENKMDATVITRVYDLKQLLSAEYDFDNSQDIQYNQTNDSLAESLYISELKELNVFPSEIDENTLEVEDDLLEM